MALANSNNDSQPNGSKTGSSDSPRDLNAIDWPALVQDPGNATKRGDLREAERAEPEWRGRP